MDDMRLGGYDTPENKKRLEEALNQSIAKIKRQREEIPMERRLSVNADGTVNGKVVIGNSAAQAAIGGVLNTPTSQALGDYLQATQAQPLTAEQRISELKKKINEYKSLLNVVSDTAAKLFFNQLLINIEKDLGEILVEVKKKPVQAAPVVLPTPAPYQPAPPFIPSYPGQPAPVWIGGKSPSILDPLPSYTVCAGRTCVTYGEDGSISATTSGGILSNSNEENQ